MQKSVAFRTFWLLIAAALFVPGAGSQTAAKPLRAGELLALVAGNALPENIVTIINADGLAFKPDDDYRGLLKTAGADATVLSALDGAKVTTDQSAEAESGKEFLQDIAQAGADLKAKQYDEAGQEVTAALKASFNDAATGFVMGEVLRQEHSWDQAQATYEQVLQEDANFPEVHTKLSFILYQQADGEGALREAKAALIEDSNNAEAHKNAGLALCNLQEWNASEAEYDEALRIKPVYAAVQADLGILYLNEHEPDKAIGALKRAIALGIADADTAYDLGYAYDQKHDPDAAIPEYRRAKELDPKRFDARQNLASDLLNEHQYAEAVTEFREQEKMFPSASVCHDCLGLALFDTWDFAGAEKEWLMSEELDPSDAGPHAGIGSIREEQKKWDEALEEYRKTVQLDPTRVDGWLGAARVLVAQHKYSEASEELKQAEIMWAGDPKIHDVRAQALAASGDLAGAVGEFQASLQLKPKQIQVMLRLASALEKHGDWVESLNEYREASLTDSAIDLRTKIIRSDELDPQKEYASAQERWNDHLAALKAARKSTDATALEAQLRAEQAAPSLSDQVNTALQSGWSAILRHDPSSAVAEYKHAVELAEKLPPNDPRLITALDDLGNSYFGWNTPAAQAAYERELQAAVNTFGPQSPQLTAPLQSLGRSALMQHDYAAAQKYLFQAVALNENAFGEGSDSVAKALVYAAVVFVVQKQYDKAEPYLLRAVHIDDSLFGKDGLNGTIPLTSLCDLYDRWGKSSEADACDQQLVSTIGKQYGANSPVLLSILVDDSKQLRALGRASDADAVDTRIASIRSATVKPN
ncbi:MAG: tetratricopeptide repeat protein [Candidatus Acidiferrales bacterium]